MKIIDKNPKTLSYKILMSHLNRGALEPGEKIDLKIDQTLTQDATGTMAYLQFEALNIPRVKTELSVSYIDHNIVQQDFKNSDDHHYLQNVAAKYGIIFSKAGNGICHQVHLERFARPGKILIGSDSHTPTAGGIGSLAIGVGGLDIALVMAGNFFSLKMPKILGIKLRGKLRKGVAAKDIILEVLRQIGVKGGVGKILEYFGPGLANLSVPERATITNMGAETGATTSIFPSDKITKEFLDSMGRSKEWVEIKADKAASYDKIIEINLNTLSPMVAKPHSPGNVVKVSAIEGIKVQQVAVGSCTNSSFKDLMTAAQMLKGKKINPNVSLAISPGSRTILEEISKNGALTILLKSGARLLENACGPCIGQNFAPPSKAISIRTFNRNFKGRSGTINAKIYLTSVETAIASAINGKLTNPRKICSKLPQIKSLKFFHTDNSLIVRPPKNSKKIKIIYGPNIRPLPKFSRLGNKLKAKVNLKLGDNITTDDITPAGKYLSLRSNVPEYAKHVFEQIDPGFYDRAISQKVSFIVGGENYGQGSSREHAALCPRYLGVKAIIAKSFARIHLANLINFGILPLTFELPTDYKKIDQGDELEIILGNFNKELFIKNFTKNNTIKVRHSLDEEEIKILKFGGKLNYIKSLNKLKNKEHSLKLRL